MILIPYEYNYMSNRVFNNFNIIIIYVVGMNKYKAKFSWGITLYNFNELEEKEITRLIAVNKIKFI